MGKWDSLYEASRAQFNSYAAIDAPDLPTDDLSAIQVRLLRWQGHNFGGASDLQLACGIAEEWGEYCKAWSGNSEDLEDAAGDMLIYCTQLASSNRLDFGVYLKAPFDGLYSLKNLSVTVGQICHIALKSSQGIRRFGDAEVRRRAYSSALTEVVSNLRGLFPFEELLGIYRNTAELILLRDWKKFPENGLIS